MDTTTVNVRAFNAIAAFMEDLDTQFDRKNKPVALYNYLLKKTSIDDTIAVNRQINAFATFFNAHPGFPKNRTLGGNMIVKYSDRVCVDIGNIFARTPKSVHRHIYHHLLMIYGMINIDTDEGKSVIEDLKTETAESANGAISGLKLPDTNEGKFLEETMSGLIGEIQNMDIENSDPMSIVSGMMQGNFFGNLMGNLQGKFENGEMDINGLLGTVTGVMSSLAPEGEQSELPEPLRSFMKNQIQTISDGQDQLDPATREQVSRFKEVTDKMVGGD